MPLVYVLLLLWWLVRAAAMAWQLARYSCVKMHYSYVMMRGQPRRRGGRTSARTFTCRYVSSQGQPCLLESLGQTAQEAYLKHWLSVPHPCLIPVGAVEPESDRESYGKARVEIHAYLGLW